MARSIEQVHVGTNVGVRLGKPMGIYFSTRAAVKICNLEREADRLQEDFYQEYYAQFFNLSVRYFNHRGTISIDPSLTPCFVLIAVALEPGTSQES